MDQDRQQARFHGDPPDNTLPAAVDSGGSLRIKLNLRVTSTGAIEGGDGSPFPPLSDGQGFRHRCDICNKGFSSGKALGGHMRMHYQSSSKVARHSFIKKNPADQGEDCCNNNKKSLEKPICQSCGKDFPSMKALYGHMRSHPERSWRGIRPPTPAPKPSSSSSLKANDRQIDSSAAYTGSNGCPVVDCSTSLPTWSVTARRGRKSNNAASTTTVFSGSEEHIHDAVQDLMLLAKTDVSLTKSNDFDRKKRKVDAIDGDSDVGTSKRKQQLQTDQVKNVLIKTATAAQGSCGKLDSYHRELSSDCHTSDDGIQEEQVKCDGEMGRKMLRVRKIKEIGKLKLAGSETANDHHQIHLKYRCNICNKAFPTHQALGGHKSSHNKPKKIQAAMALQTSSGLDSTTSEDGDCIKFATPPAKEISSTETQGQEAGDGSARSSRHQSAGIFNMTIITCHQGIEGCKGGHSIGTVEAQSSQVTSPGESSQTGRRILDIDLNELPPMEEGEGVESYLFYQQQPNN